MSCREGLVSGELDPEPTKSFLRRRIAWHVLQHLLQVIDGRIWVGLGVDISEIDELEDGPFDVSHLEIEVLELLSTLEMRRSEVEHLLQMLDRLVIEAVLDENIGLGEEP